MIASSKWNGNGNTAFALWSTKPYISLLLSTQIWKNRSPPIELTTQIEQNSIQFFARSLPPRLSVSLTLFLYRARWKKLKTFFFSSIYYVCGTSRIYVVRAHCIVHLAELFYMRRNSIVVVALRFFNGFPFFSFVSFISRSCSFSAMITLFVGAFFAVRISALPCSHRVAIDAEISVQCDDVIHSHTVTPLWPHTPNNFSKRLHGLGGFAFISLSLSIQFRFLRLHAYIGGVRWRVQQRCIDWFDINSQTTVQRRKLVKWRASEGERERCDAFAEVVGSEADGNRFKAL